MDDPAYTKQQLSHETYRQKRLQPSCRIPYFLQKFQYEISRPPLRHKLQKTKHVENRRHSSNIYKYLRKSQICKITEKIEIFYFLQQYFTIMTMTIVLVILILCLYVLTNLMSFFLVSYLWNIIIKEENSVIQVLTDYHVIYNQIFNEWELAILILPWSSRIL